MPHEDTPYTSADPFAGIRGDEPTADPIFDIRDEDLVSNTTPTQRLELSSDVDEPEAGDVEPDRRSAVAASIAERLVDLSPTVEEDLATLDRFERRLHLCGHASVVLSYNGETVDPPRAAASRGEALAALEELRVETLSAGELGTVLERLSAKAGELTAEQAAQVRVLARDRREAMAVPTERLSAFTRLTVEAGDVWHHAKSSGDWASFEPYLDRIVEGLREQASFLDATRDPYDVWLDQFERGTNRVFYDAFFEELRASVVPLLSAIQDTGWQPNDRSFRGKFDHNRQLALSRELMRLEGVDLDALTLGETEHPFSDSVASSHAFIATHIHEYDLLSNVYSMLHEGGHALYEMGVNPAFDHTSLRGGTSMGVHESQSRFFENIIGRSRAFMRPLIGALSSCFPGRFNGVSQRELYQVVNRVQPSLIRTEADELTYPLHVMVRYEIEKALFEGQATAKDVPLLWGRLYRRYLGVTVPDHTQGALQDSHWSGGALGYFPTYALGSAYGAQFLVRMLEGGVDVERACASGDLSPIRRWLGERVWRHGRSLDAPELIQRACDEPFDPGYYTSYLEQKFRALYRV